MLGLPEHLKGPSVKLAFSMSNESGPYITADIGSKSVAVMTPLSCAQVGNCASQLHSSSVTPLLRHELVS